MTNKWKDGLPPVGEECLVRHKVASKDLCKAVINFVGNKTFNATWSLCGTEFCNEIAAFEFKPIKTPAEIERERAIKPAARILSAKGMFNPNLTVTLMDLYDAGLLSDPANRVKPMSFEQFKTLLDINNHHYGCYEGLISDGHIIQGVDSNDS